MALLTVSRSFTDWIFLYNSTRGSMYLFGFTPQQLLAHFQSQQDGAQTTPNDCAVVALAMAANQALTALGCPELKLRYSLLARRMDRFPPCRLPAWLPPNLGRGATPPLGVRLTLQALPGELRRLGLAEVDWRVKLSRGNTPQGLQENLAKGNPTLIYGRWRDTGIPHVVTLAGYEDEQDSWYVLDPGMAHPAFRRWTTSELLDFWGAYRLGPFRVYGAGTLVVLELS
jgi:hypothetical protein